MFSQIKGHDGEIRELQKHLGQDRVSHAYLFQGISGIGKALIATQYAKAILCEGQGCGQCRSCTVFDAKTHPDFLWIEDEKSVKVQSVLSLIDFIMTKPMLASHKVAVINEAEKMTVAAQNKLLKIFEEPPSYAVIILVVNNAASLIDTIKSRGFAVDFKPLAPEQIEALLTERLGQSDSWRSVSLFAQGSLEKALANASDEAFQSIRQYPERVFDAVIARDVVKLIHLNLNIDDLPKRSDDLIDYMLTWLRDVSILKKSRQSLLIVNEDRREELLRQANYLSMEMVMACVNAVEGAKRLIDNHVNARVVMNHCLLKIQEEYDEYSNRCEI